MFSCRNEAVALRKETKPTLVRQLCPAERDYCKTSAHGLINGGAGNAGREVGHSSPVFKMGLRGWAQQSCFFKMGPAYFGQLGTHALKYNFGTLGFRDI